MDDQNQELDPSRPATGSTDEARERLRSPERVVTLTDGVFAIIITILVLELKVPANLSHASLDQAFEELRPTLVAWVVSFLITGMYWVAHRDIFARVRAVNRDLVWLNLLFLLPAALIPFAASVLGEYPDETLALQFYGVVLIAVSLMRVAIYLYVVRRPQLLWEGSLTAKTRQGLVLMGLPIVIYLVAMAIAAVSTTASIVLFFSVPLLYFLAVTVARERGGKNSEADDFS